MPRFAKRFIETDVVTEAKKRIRRAYEEFDHVSTSFSGGKDSLVLLHLVKEVAIEEMGIADKITVLFIDEELIHQSVIDFVDGYYHQPWCDMTWLATPMRSHKYVLGRITDYIQWDPARDPSKGGIGWVRGRPDYATTEADLGLLFSRWAAATNPSGNEALGIENFDVEVPVINQYVASEVMAQKVKGRYMQLCGMRCSESLLRYAMISSAGHKPSEAWIGMPTLGRVYLGKPIYDMAENDIFRFFYDRGITYCPIYDSQMYAGLQYRVGTCLTSEAAGRLNQLRASDPDLYDSVQRIFPDMTVHERYVKEYDELDHMRDTGELERLTYEGVRAWCALNLEAKWLNNATKMIERGEREPMRYPPDYLLQAFTRGAYKRGYLAYDPRSPMPDKKVAAR